MSIHISAATGEIARIVLMPGDPLRARHIALTQLESPVLVSDTRNMLYYTGFYNHTRVTIGGSGMGCPSTGIYSHELYSQYGVACIIRIGTAGAYTTELELYDLLNADKAFSESSYALHAHGFTDSQMDHQGPAFDLINATAGELKFSVKSGNIHSSDVFYRVDTDIPSMASMNHCLAVEMESFALFSNAKQLNKMAACLLTISDIISTGQRISADERENSLQAMTRLSLESVVRIDASLG